MMSDAGSCECFGLIACVINEVAYNEQIFPWTGFTSESTTMTSDMSVTNVGKPLYAMITSPNIRKYTLVQYKTYNSGILLCLSLASSFVIGSTLSHSQRTNVVFYYSTVQ